MWLLLRVGADERAAVDQLTREGWPASAYRFGERTFIQVKANGHTSEVLPNLPEVERVLTASPERPLLVHEAQPAPTIGTWKRGEKPLWIAGPCSVESRSQLRVTAHALRDLGVVALRGGAFKARTSPYSFQGLGAEAIDLLLEAKAETDLPLCVEVLSETHLLLYEHIDILQVGARNMDHYELLKAVGQMQKPILLKRNPQATLEEFLLAAEYVLLYGAPMVLLCERGIRTFERRLRYTLDVGAIAVLRSEIPWPVIADPSHAAGEAAYVQPLALAAIGAGAEGLIVEVHPQPHQALSDAQQQLSIEAFAHLMEKVERVWATQRDLASPTPTAKAAS